MWRRLLGMEYARRNARQKAAAGIMRDFLGTPLAPGKTLCRQLEIAALDLETTGLDPRQDRILSIGLVLIKDMSINLASAWQSTLRIEGELPEDTVIIHGITDDQAAQGQTLQSVLPLLLSRLCGRILLVHNVALEQAFLDRACHQVYGVPFIMPVIDTQALAKRQYERRDIPIKPGDLRLFNLRERYKLPRYNAHNALSDALATAELFLAIAAEISPTGNCRLKDVLRK